LINILEVENSASSILEMSDLKSRRSNSENPFFPVNPKGELYRIPK